MRTGGIIGTEYCHGQRERLTAIGLVADTIGRTRKRGDPAVEAGE